MALRCVGEERDVMRQAPPGISRDRETRVLQQLIQKPITTGMDLRQRSLGAFRVIVRCPTGGLLKGGRHARCQGNRLRSGSKSLFLSASPLEWLEMVVRCRSREQQPDPFRAAKFVSRCTEKVDGQSTPIRASLAHHLGGIGMEGDALTRAGRTDGLNRLKGSYFALPPDH